MDDREALTLLRSLVVTGDGAGLVGVLGAGAGVHIQGAPPDQKLAVEDLVEGF